MSMNKDILFLSMEDVIEAGGSDIASAANDIQRAFELFDQGEVLQPHKTTLKVTKKGGEQGTGLVNFLPAYVNLDGHEIFSVKALGAMPSNVEKGLPRATGLITLFDSATKSPICIMDAQVISAVRTGAVSLLAAKKFVNPRATEIGLIGAGVNMRTQLLGLKEALPNLRKVKVHSRGVSKLRFAIEMSKRTGLEIIPVDSSKEAVTNMEMIVTCLPNVTSPVVMANHVRERGVTVFNIGCYECEDVLLSRMDRVVADVWEQGKHRGAQTHAIAVKHGVIDESIIEDLSPILNNKRPGRLSDDENIFFCPTGLGFEDAVVAWRVYNNAKSKNLGTQLNLWKDSKWI
jgi:ornithine cyclodeaminase/alanine dehydrogenase-like protein (mu-crystallin family)